jgi:ornithine cyclodeaminase
VENRNIDANDGTCMNPTNGIDREPEGAAALDSLHTIQRLPYRAMTAEIRRILTDTSVQVPPRLVHRLPGGGSLFVMPATDNDTAVAKLITWTPGNTGSELPTIQGDVVVFDVATGQRRLILDGPTVTARRTAAVSLVAAQCLAPQNGGPMLIVGAGVQGRAHLDAFVEEFSVKEVVIASRSMASAQALSRYAQSLGVSARTTTDPNAELARCPIVVTCTPANAVVLDSLVHTGTFISAVGAFTPHMRELGTALCLHVANSGTIVVDTPEACHEAGDLLQAGLNVALIPCLRDVLSGTTGGRQGPVLFKSCGWAGWDLAAARVAMRHKA